MHRGTLVLLCLCFAAPVHAEDRVPPAARPNILFAIADDWGYPHASAYGDPVVRTPTFDRLAKEGVLLTQAYVSSPSCTPSRGAILTGQFHWRLEAGANLWSIFPDKFATYPEMLAANGYTVGVSGKAWGPGKTETAGRPLAGKPFKSFDQFLADRPRDQPFCFWLGSSDPHRPYVRNSGAESGLALDKIRLPATFPDDPIVRGDVADYYFEVQRFDQLVGQALESLEKAGERENTIIVVTGDHGMPFPRGKSNLYDLGTHVPLVISWPQQFPSGRTVDDFVSLTDLAPTFLELAGVPIPETMTGRSLADLLRRKESGQIDPERSFVLTGKERHVPSQRAPDMGGYPCRAIRTRDHLYIRNFRPDRWPNGIAEHQEAAIPGVWFGDTDNGPTKTFIIDHRADSPAMQRLYDLSFAKRPAEELYDLTLDPEQLENRAGQPAYAAIQLALSHQLTKELRRTLDPRIIGGAEELEAHPYFGKGPRHPSVEPNP